MRFLGPFCINNTKGRLQLLQYKYNKYSDKVPISLYIIIYITNLYMVMKIQLVYMTIYNIYFYYGHVIYIYIYLKRRVMSIVYCVLSFDIISCCYKLDYYIIIMIQLQHNNLLCNGIFITHCFEMCRCFPKKKTVLCKFQHQFVCVFVLTTYSRTCIYLFLFLIA